MLHEYAFGEHLISNDKSKLNLTLIQHELDKTYWAKGITKATVQTCIDNSLTYGVYRNLEQIGFARVITDYCTFAYLSDVFILSSEKGKGLSKILIETILKHPKLQNLRRFVLVTQDAHTLYERFGFKALQYSERYMEKTW